MDQEKVRTARNATLDGTGGKASSGLQGGHGRRCGGAGSG